jgi:hypothetical protein
MGDGLNVPIKLIHEIINLSNLDHGVKVKIAVNSVQTLSVIH